MIDHLISFQTFATVDEAIAIAEKLQQDGIRTEVVKAAPQFSAVIIGSSYSDSYILKIPAADFSKANKILYSYTPVDISLIDANHPLHAMTNGELREVLAKPDEWGADNYSVALALLNSRGVSMSSGILNKLKDERITVLAERKAMNPTIIFLGYFMSCYPAMLYISTKLGYHALFLLGAFGIFSDFLLVLGIILGFVIIGSKITLPDGSRIPTYNKTSRYHAIVILTIYGITIGIMLIYSVSMAVHI